MMFNVSCLLICFCNELVGSLHYVPFHLDLLSACVVDAFPDFSGHGALICLPEAQEKTRLVIGQF